MTQALILVNGLPGSGKTTLADSFASELGAVCISKDAIKEAVSARLPLPFSVAERMGAATMDFAWQIAALVEGTAILEARARDPLHRDQHQLQDMWPRWAAEAAPLYLSEVLRVETGHDVDVPAAASSAATLLQGQRLVSGGTDQSG